MKGAVAFLCRCLLAQHLPRRAKKRNTGFALTGREAYLGHCQCDSLFFGDWTLGLGEIRLMKLLSMVRFMRALESI